MNYTIVDEDVERILAQPLPWHLFSDTSVLISGAAGMLPAYLVEILMALARSGGGPRRIICLVRSAERARKRFERHLRHPALKIVEADVSQTFAIDDPVDYIVHAASQASPRFYGVDPVGTLSANVFGTRNLLELARIKCSKAVLFFSSAEVYGSLPADAMPNTEDSYGYLDPTQVRSCYSESKRAGETMCIAWAQQYGLHATIVRPFHTFGPGLAKDDGRVFADFVADLAASRDIVIKGDGKAVRTFCYLADAAAAYFAILLKGKSCFAYNVGGDEEVTIRQLAERLAKAFASRGISARLAERQPDDAAYLASTVNRVVPDLSRIRSLGWRPSTSLEEAFRRTVEALAPAPALATSQASITGCGERIFVA